jgi:hypothetical protein
VDALAERLREVAVGDRAGNLPGIAGFPYPEDMEVHFAPELQAKLERLIIETGCPIEQLIEDALAGYVPELSQTREMLDSRYDDLKSGRVKAIPGEAFFESLRQRADERLKKP